MNELAESQKRFYLNKYQRYGDDPRSLSWNDKNSQYLRFEKISELFTFEKRNLFTVHEIGCGLAHFKTFIGTKKYNLTYSGSDIIEEFIVKNQEKIPECSFFIANISDDLGILNEKIQGFDYYFLNGTFHTKGLNDINEWEFFIFRSINNMFHLAKKGICINFLTSFSDYQDDLLYYANPGQIMNWCIEKCSRFVIINHNLPLFEFFVYIYKEDFINGQYPEYQRYFKV